MTPLSAIVTLKDGRRAVLRPPAPVDADELAELNREVAEDYGNVVPDADEAMTDADALGEMLRENENGGKTAEEMLRTEEGGGSGVRGFLLGAFVGSALAGTVSLFVVSLRKVSHVAELGLAVRPAFKGLGLGRALLDEATSAARRRGFVKLVVRVFAHNEPALALYRSAGFVEEGRQARQYLFRDGTYRDGIWMAKFLD
jgi:ribosomal protein S18 acetylase RimI-like enzyme